MTPKIAKKLRKNLQKNVAKKLHKKVQQNSFAVQPLIVHISYVVFSFWHFWQGCQIFLVKHTKMGKYVPNNTPSDHSINQNFLFQGLLERYQNPTLIPISDSIYGSEGSEKFWRQKKQLRYQNWDFLDANLCAIWQP
jgi:hypothetical protein